MAYVFWMLTTDVPKAQGNQKAIIKLIHVCDSFQIPVNQNETVVLPQESGSLKHSALYHRSCYLLISIIIFGAKFFMLVRCIFMTSLSESEAFLFLQPFGKLKKSLSQCVFRDPPYPRPSG